MIQVKTTVPLGQFMSMLFQDDGPRLMSMLENGMGKALASSFRQDRHPARHRTNAETTRRIGIMIEWTRKLLDAGWSVARICDHMDVILDTELDGNAWVPPERTIWMPGDN